MPLAVKVVDGTVQLKARPLSLVIEAPGKVLSKVVLTLAIEVQPLAPVTVTVNVPAVETVIAAVVEPVFQRKLPFPVAVRIVLGMEQLKARPLSLVIEAPGDVLSRVVVAVAVEVHPLAPVTVTVNVPAVETVMAAVVALVLQR